MSLIFLKFLLKFSFKNLQIRRLVRVEWHQHPSQQMDVNDGPKSRHLGSGSDKAEANKKKTPRSFGRWADDLCRGRTLRRYSGGNASAKTTPSAVSFPFLAHFLPRQIFFFKKIKIVFTLITCTAVGNKLSDWIRRTIIISLKMALIYEHGTLSMDRNVDVKVCILNFFSKKSWFMSNF